MKIVSQKLLDLLTLRNRRVNAMAIWPFIIFKDRNCLLNPEIHNHERIHHRQQLELLILPYYIWYFSEYWFAMLSKGFDHDKAYRSISFEREAYAHQGDADYLRKRPFLANRNYLLKNENKQ